MHPYGGTPYCPRCSKAVYAAEQIMGPGRKLYHKPCLVCTSCSKRLDSLSLVEHDKEPYCKQCHTRLFGTRDLRQANLPHRDDLFSSSRPQSPHSVGARSPPASPTRVAAARPTSPPISGRIESRGRVVDGSPAGIVRPMSRSPPPLRATRSLSPTYAASHRSADQNTGYTSFASAVPEEADGQSPGNAHHDHSSDPHKEMEKEPQKLGIPRTIPLTTALTNRARLDSSTEANSSSMSMTSPPPLSPNHMNATPPRTGTRYGAALGGVSPSIKPHPLVSAPAVSGWGGRGMPGTGTPSCARCGKPVYFAEQVKASGKTFHKLCLKCTVCDVGLSPGKVTERDGQVMCQSCYGKLHGPAGSGYALLGKAGG